MAKSSLAQKLRILPSSRILFVNAPKEFEDALGELPEGASLSKTARGKFEVVLGFFNKKAELDSQVDELTSALAETGILWVAYPKGTAKMPTDLNRDILHAHLSKKKLEGVAMVAIDETWSAMRFKWRP